MRIDLECAGLAALWIVRNGRVSNRKSGVKPPHSKINLTRYDFKEAHD